MGLLTAILARPRSKSEQIGGTLFPENHPEMGIFQCPTFGQVTDY